MSVLLPAHQEPDLIGCDAEPLRDTRASARDQKVDDAILVDDPLDGSLTGDQKTLTIGLLLIVAALYMCGSPATLVFPGVMRLAVKLVGCVLAMFFGVEKTVIALRRIRIRRHRANPRSIWKEALRAEYEGSFSEAARLYGEIAALFPNTAIAEDAASSVAILRRERKRRLGPQTLISI